VERKTALEGLGTSLLWNRSTLTKWEIPRHIFQNVGKTEFLRFNVSYFVKLF
jgi:hypothetical protein